LKYYRKNKNYLNNLEIICKILINQKIIIILIRIKKFKKKKIKIGFIFKFTDNFKAIFSKINKNNKTKILIMKRMNKFRKLFNKV